jgi:hypothetical protein
VAYLLFDHNRVLSVCTREVMLACGSIVPVRVGPGVWGGLGYQARSGVSARGVPERETVITPRRL